MAIINTIGNGLPSWNKLPTLWLSGYKAVYRDTGDSLVIGSSDAVFTIIDGKYWMKFITGTSNKPGTATVFVDTLYFTPITSFSLLIPEVTDPYFVHNNSPDTLTGTVYNIHFQAWERYELHYENHNDNYSYDYNFISIDRIIHTGTSSDYFGDEEEKLLPRTTARTFPNSDIHDSFAYLQIV